MCGRGRSWLLIRNLRNCLVHPDTTHFATNHRKRDSFNSSKNENIRLDKRAPNGKSSCRNGPTGSRGESTQQTPEYFYRGGNQKVKVGVSVGLQPNDDELANKVGAFIEKGYSRIKLKIKPGRDVEMVGNIRNLYPDTPIMVDANSAYTLEDLDILKELDQFDLMMIEQPLAYDDYLDHSRLQQELNTPICLDESIRSVRDVKLAAELGSCRIVNIKPGRVGGIASSQAIHDYCLKKDIPVWCGGMLESGVGRAHNVALASLPGFVLPGDISESQRYWAEDIVDPEFTISNGLVEVPTGNGIGVDILEDLVDRLTVQSAEY